jgi:hypothetical protein
MGFVNARFDDTGGHRTIIFLCQFFLGYGSHNLMVVLETNIPSFLCEIPIRIMIKNGLMAKNMHTKCTIDL